MSTDRTPNGAAGLPAGTYELWVDRARGQGRIGVWFAEEPRLAAALATEHGGGYLLRLRRPVRGIYVRRPWPEPHIEITSAARAATWPRLAWLYLTHPAALVNRLLRRRITFDKSNGDALFLTARDDPRSQEERACDLRREIDFHEVQLWLRRIELENDSPQMLRHPEIDAGWPAPEGPFRPHLPPRAGAIAVVVHLYYQEMWPEIDAVLRHVGHDFDLHITWPRPDPALAATIRAAYPTAQLYEVENRGRDIAPFVRLLNEGVFEKYGYICKLQTKKSVSPRGDARFGSRWRRCCFAELMGAGCVSEILDRFDAEPRLGLVGPGVLRIPNRWIPAERAWGGNRERVLALAERMGLAAEQVRLDFFAGSMFWFRPAALAPLRRLQLGRDDFPDEQGQVDETTQHAIERLFIPAALAAGFVAENTEATPAAVLE